jgi:hypothetical protein
VTVQELIYALQKIEPRTPVCGQSETSTWHIKPKDIVYTAATYVDGELLEKVLILGYKH